VKRVFDPIAKDLEQYEYGKELVPGITALDARGHSPGHTAFLVSSGSGKLLVTSDAVNHQILVRNPDWALWADMDPATAAASRKRLLDMAATDKIQIAAYHLPFPSTGFISKQGSGYEFHPAYWQAVL
jgi:glyoxylase-like metal-dependent hydrolase (beta-lactamase superfamily II)